MTKLREAACVVRRISFCSGAAIALMSACSTHQPLHASGGTSGSGTSTIVGGTVGTGGSGGSLPGSGGIAGLGAYYGGDGIAPTGGGGALFGSGGTLSGGGGGAGGGSQSRGGSGGAGGVDINCFMRCGQGNAIYYSGGAGGRVDAMPASSDSSASDCDTRRTVYYAAVTAAEQCDPMSAVPCTGYDGVECPSVGVNPVSVDALSAKLSEFKAAGCILPLHSCPSFVMTPPPYTCQPGPDGVYKCYSLCENMAGGLGTCVSQSTGCAGTRLSAGFCSGPSMDCCAR